MHQRQCPRNLLGRVICLQVAGALVTQGGGPKAVCDARPYRPGRHLGRIDTVGACHRKTSSTTMPGQANLAVSTKLRDSIDGEPIQPHGDRRKLDALPQLCMDHRPLFKTQLRIDVPMQHDLPKLLHLAFVRTICNVDSRAVTHGPLILTSWVSRRCE